MNIFVTIMYVKVNNMHIVSSVSITTQLFVSAIMYRAITRIVRHEYISRLFVYALLW